MFLFGIGFKSIDQRRYYKRNERYKNHNIWNMLLEVSNQFVWVWVAIEHLSKLILGIRISFERTMLIAEQFLKCLVKRYG